MAFPRLHGSSAGSVVQAARSMRRLRRSKLLRPKVWRFSIFSLPTCPSVCPLLHAVVSAAFTAAPSYCNPAAKVVTAATPLLLASLSQPSRVAFGLWYASCPVISLGGGQPTRWRLFRAAIMPFLTIEKMAR